MKLKWFSVLAAICFFSALVAFSGNIHAADSIKGSKIYNQHCANCHGASGVSNIPGVADFSRGEGLFKSDIELLKLLQEGVGMMPAYRGRLSEQEMLDVIAYMRTLR